MASVYRERKKWTVAFYDSNGERHYVRGVASKAMAQQIGQEREFGKQAAKHGLIDPRAEKYAREAARPLDKHVEEFGQYLTAAKKDTPGHVAEVTRDVLRVLTAAGTPGIDRIDRVAVIGALGGLKPLRGKAKARVSHRTRNKAAAACRSFTAWLCHEAKRAPTDELARLPMLDVEQDRHRRRQQLTEAQVVRLIEATADQPERGGMTGIDRMMRYAIGLGTGFRQGTLFGLRPDAFHLDGPEPFIHVQATNIKSRKAVDHPVSRELADLIRPWLAGKARTRPVFPRLAWASVIRAYRHDLKAAGIPYHEEGSILYCDQHAQRGTFITAVIRAAGLKVAQDLAHHSTPNLTSKYGQMSMDDYGKALDGLPKLGRPKGEAKRKGAG